MSLFARQQQNLANKPPSIVSEVEKVIRESAGQQIPPGALPEDRVAPSTTEGDVAVTVDGKTQWAAPESLSSYIDLLTADALLDQKIEDLRDDAEMWQAAKVNRAGDTMTGALYVGTNIATGFVLIDSLNPVIQVRTVSGGIQAVLATTYLMFNNDWILSRTSSNVAELSDGDYLRQAQDGVHVNDMVRLRQLHGVQQSVDDLRDDLDGHHHDDRYGRQAGYARLTTNTAGSGDLLSFSVVGDGVTTLEIVAQGHVASSGGALNTFQLDIRDGAGGTGTSYDRALAVIYTAGYGSDLSARASVAPFTGTKTFYLNMQNSAGTPTAYGANRHFFMRATWAPGYSTT